jgi:putative transcriptional regulator
MTENQNYNRIKAVLADKNRTGKWLAQQLGRTENTVSRWCGNKIQPSIVQLNEIAKILEVDVSELLRKTDNVG